MAEAIIRTIPEKTEARFWKKVDKREPDECWPWLAATSSNGYGHISVRARLAIATHVALTIDGRIRPSEKHHALHSCDNPICVNPAHLRWGTNKENMQDRTERRGKYPCAPKKPNAKLTEDQVRLIRSSPLMGIELAAILGVHKATISDVRCRKIWRHIE